MARRLGAVGVSRYEKTPKYSVPIICIGASACSPIFGTQYNTPRGCAVRIARNHRSRMRYCPYSFSLGNKPRVLRCQTAP